MIARHPVSTPPTLAPQLSGFSISSSTSQQSTLNSALPSDSPKSFPCVSYAKTRGYPSWSYQCPSSTSKLSVRLTSIIPTLARPSVNSNHSRTYKTSRGEGMSGLTNPRKGLPPFLCFLNVLYFLFLCLLHSPPIHNPVTLPSPTLLPLLSQSTSVWGPTHTPCLPPSHRIRYTSTDAIRPARSLHEARTDY